ncbi:hypothetical protein [Massilia sp. IC2-278]|uniref:hypothetical protein n=1 Tax=Massilia sp. IC2-278 TaxID=2887200 RepID=UPI001E3C5482|nr:hypothetical protein [Massilia sp. IC2-278]
MNTTCYQPSGRVPVALLPMSLLGLLAVLPCGWIYAWAIGKVPLVIGAFLAFGYSAVLGLIVSLVAVGAKVRNPGWMSKVGVVFALAGWYCQWVFWLTLLMTSKTEALGAGEPLQVAIRVAADPVGMFLAASDIATSGGVTISKAVVPAFIVALFWLGELAMHLMLPSFMGRLRACEPFCEASLSWARKQVVECRFALLGSEDVERLAADPSLLPSLLVPLAPDAPDYAEVTLYRCRASDAYVSLVNVTSHPGDSGRPEKKQELLVDYLRLPGIDVDTLIRQLTQKQRIVAQDEDAGRPVAPELAPALAFLQDGAHEQACTAAAARLSSDNPAVQADALRICALACSGLERWLDARYYWQALFDHEPSAHNALQAATTSVMAGATAQGVDWVEQAAALNLRSRELPMLQVWIGFVTALGRTGQERAALPYLEKIRQVYAELGTTDATVLYAQRIPFFGAFLDNTRPLVRAALDDEQGRRWYASLLPSLDDRGRQELNAWLDESFGDSACQQPAV